MKVLLFITGFRQVKEYDYFCAFLHRLSHLPNLCDIFIYCNNAKISEDIVTYYKKFKQPNKRLLITSQNVGHGMGAVEAVSNGIEMGLFDSYDYVIHLHPDVFVTDDAKIIEILNENLESDCVFFVNKSYPDDARFFSFDFFIFKPKLLPRNIFADELYSYTGLPEHYLFDVIERNQIKHKLIKRFHNDDWQPRRVDEHLKLYHEHDLERVLDLLRKTEVRQSRWTMPVVELRQK